MATFAATFAKVAASFSHFQGGWIYPMFTLSHARYIHRCGYTKRVAVVGGPGATELGLFTRSSTREDARFALVPEKYPAPGTHGMQSYYANAEQQYYDWLHFLSFVSGIVLGLTCD